LRPRFLKTFSPAKKASSYGSGGFKREGLDVSGCETPQTRGGKGTSPSLDHLTPKTKSLSFTINGRKQEESKRRHQNEPNHYPPETEKPALNKPLTAENPGQKNMVSLKEKKGK